MRETNIERFSRAVLALSVFLSGCQVEPAPETGRSGRLHRLIANPTENLLKVENVRKSKPALGPVLDFEPTDSWKVVGTGRISLTDGHMRIFPEDDFVRVTRFVDWNSATIDSIEIAFAKTKKSGGNLKFYWAGPDEQLAEHRSRSLKVTETRIFTLELKNHPFWLGKISKIRLDIPCPTQTTQVLSSIQTMKFEYDEKKLAGLQEKNWKVEINHDFRNAMVTPAGHPVSWPLPEAIRGKLLFSYGVLEALEDSSQLQIIGEKSDGQKILVFETTLEKTDTAGWQEAQIDLESWEPFRKLTFEISPAIESGAFGGIGVWANPCILEVQDTPKKPNVILISLDTLRADRLSLYGYPITTSPNIDEWARRQGVIFQKTVASSPRTLPSHVSMFTGLDAVTHGVNHYFAAPLDLEMIAERLRLEGYTTVASTGGGLVGPGFGLAQGFDEFYSYPGWPGGFEELETEMQHALSLVSRIADQPFFLFFHTYEIHDPFQERPPYSDRCYSETDDLSERDFIYGALPRPRCKDDDYLLYYDLVKWKNGTPISSAVPVGNDELDLVSCLYDSGIAYTDAQIIRLFDKLKEMDLMKNTVIVLTSDHGEALGEKGLFKHAFLYDNNLMIPLIMSFPGGRYQGQIVSTQVSTVDIFPTILDFLGLEIESVVDGESLLPLILGQKVKSPREAWSYAAHENRGLSLRIDNQFKYTFNNSWASPAHQAEQLFNLAADPDELRNFATEDPDAVVRFRDRMQDYFEAKSGSIRVRLENRNCEHLTGSILINALRTQVKAFTIEDEHLSLASENQADFLINRGEAVTLFVESTGKLVLRLDAERCEPTIQTSEKATTLDLATLRAPWRLALTAEGWQESQGESPAWKMAAISISVEPAHGAVGSPLNDSHDQDMLEQLRSLGYVQ